MPRGVRVMNPYAHERVCGYLRAFLDKYYADNDPRVLVIGINPGRFGAGITGVTFTDPIALAETLGIANDLPRKPELSSLYVYRFIERYGGPGKFFRRFFLTAASPLGFTHRGKNYNYYDEPALKRAVEPFITATIRDQIAMGGRRDNAIVFGTGENLNFLQRLNEEHAFFAQLFGLEHPRFIMQYRRRRLDEYLDRYTEIFRKAEG